MRPPLGHFFMADFGTEIIYSFVIILCSLMIYLGTKELYELSSHKGIRYFRGAFLFFALAYFFRSFVKLILHYSGVCEYLGVHPGFFRIFSLFLFMYFSAMAVFYLLFSVKWKKWRGNSKIIYVFYLFSLIIAVVGTLLKNHLIHLGINLFLLLFVVSTVYISYKESKKKDLYWIYLFLCIFWILNIVDILIPKFLQTFQLFIYLASLMMFLLIFYRVIKRLGK
jgi:hypothetical protein